MPCHGCVGVALLQWLNRLTEASSDIPDPIERHRAQLMATLILGVGLIGFLVVTTLYFLQPEFGERYPITMAALVGYGLIFRVARTRHWRSAGTVAALLAIVTSLIVGALEPEDRVWAAAQSLSIIFATVFLSFRVMVTIAAVSYVGNWVMLFVHPGFADPDLRWPTLTIVTLMYAMLILAAQHRNRVEAMRRDELGARETMLREAQRMACIGNWGVDLESGASVLSDECKRLLGCESLPEPGLAGLLEFVDEADRAAFESSVEQAQSQGHGQFRAQVLLHDATGASHHVHSVVQLTVVDGKERLEGTFQDVSERVRAERAQEALRRELAEARRLETIGRLAGGIAHDFNNLLTVVVANTALLQRNQQDERLDEIADVADRASALVKQLLAFARRQVLEPQILSPVQLVGDLQNILARLAGEAVSLQIALPEESWPVRVDPGQFEQVLINLVVNARDAMPDGGELSIELGNEDVQADSATEASELRPGRWVVLTVRDSGVGMDDDTVKRIFEPFFTTKGPSKGTGLGLATVHGIIHQSDGVITVDSEPGKGTVFRIYLPASDEQATESPARISLADAASDADRPRAVLLVDDEEMIRRAAQAVLAAAGYQVHSAADGTEAIELYDEHGSDIDLLVTDIVMPGIEGRELARRLKGKDPGLPVLFMSGYADSLIESRARGSAVLPKPFTPERLLERVDSFWTTI